MSSRRKQIATLTCLVCGLVLLPEHLEGKALQECSLVALRHAQGHCEDRGRGLAASVSYWRVYAQTGGR